MRRKMMCLLCIVSLCLLLPQSGGAQARIPELRATSPTFVMRFSGNAVTEGLILPRAIAQAITLQLSNVRVDQALDAIAAAGRFTLLYSRDIVPVTKRVSIDVKEGTVADALRQVLRGEELELLVSSTGQMAIVPSGYQQGQGVVTGKVVHAKTRQPLAGVTVSTNDGKQSIVTERDGTFRLPVAADGQTIEARAIGYVRQTHRATFGSGVTQVTMEFVLEPSASVLDEVIVTGTVIATERRAIPTPITVIRGEDLEARGITRIEQLLRGEVPGLFALERGAADYSTQDVGQGVRSTIYSRGSASLNGGPNPIKTYIDGVELLDPSYLGTIDPKSIERIEIITGPQAATIYGSGAMGGVMQIFTKRGNVRQKPDISLALRYGMLQNNFSQGITPTHNDGLTIQGGTSPELTYSANLSYVYTGQWQPKLYQRRYGASIGATHTRDRVTVGATYSATNSTQGTWRWSGLAAYYGMLQLRSSERGQSAQNFAALMTSGQVSLTSSQTVALSADYRATTQWQHHMTIGRSQNIMQLKPVTPSFAPLSGAVGADTLFLVQRSSGQRTTWNYNTSYIVNPSWISSSLTVGANGSFGDQLSVRGSQASATSSAIIGDAASFRALEVTLPLNDKSWGSFASWQIGLFRQLYTTLGLRVEQNPSYGQDVKFDFTPTNGLTYTIEQGAVSLKLMGSYGRATRPPPVDYRLEQVMNLAGYDIGQVVWQFANPQLRPEYSRGPQGGFELYLGNRGSLTLNHFSQTITDLIQSVTVDTAILTRLADGGQEMWEQTQFRNVAKVRQQGWEGTAVIALGPVTAKGTYSWSDSRVRSLAPGTYNSYQPGESFRDIPTHTGNVTIGYARGLSSVTLVTNFVGDRVWCNCIDRSYNQLQYERMKMYNIKARNDALYVSHPGYAKSDLSGSHRLASNLTLTLNIVNIGDRYDSETGTLNPSLGRQTTLGFSYRFGRQ